LDLLCTSPVFPFHSHSFQGDNPALYLTYNNGEFEHDPAADGTGLVVAHYPVKLGKTGHLAAIKISASVMDQYERMRMGCVVRWFWFLSWFGFYFFFFFLVFQGFTFLEIIFLVQLRFSFLTCRSVEVFLSEDGGGHFKSIMSGKFEIPGQGMRLEVGVRRSSFHFILCLCLCSCKFSVRMRLFIYFYYSCCCCCFRVILW
jgi:hypothetical protein